MSRHDDFMAVAMPHTLFEFGESISYTPNGGGARTIKGCIVGPGEEHAAALSLTLDHREVALMISARSDTEGVITPKAAGDTTSGGAADQFTWNSKTWYVLEVVERNRGGQHLLRASTKLLPRNAFGR